MRLMLFMVMVVGVVLAGCVREPAGGETGAGAGVSGGGGAPAAPAAAASAPAPAATSAEKPAAAPSAGPPIITGHAFKGKDFDPPTLETNGMQLLKHKGSIAGEVKLAKACSKMTLKLKPRIVDGSAPIVSLKMERIGGGKYLQMRPVQDHPVEDARPVVKEAAIEAGTYRVTLELFKSTKEKNAHLEVYSVQFE